MDGKARAETDSRQIVLAGGCFWGTEAYFSRLRGVLSTECGYANGHTVNPDYRAVCEGGTGHAEAVRVIYDPAEYRSAVYLKSFLKRLTLPQKTDRGLIGGLSTVQEFTITWKRIFRP